MIFVQEAFLDEEGGYTKLASWGEIFEKVQQHVGYSKHIVNRIS